MGNSRCVTRMVYFNPRSPHGERRLDYAADVTTTGFQSTLPARGATPAQQGHHCRHADFNPRSPHGERHTLTIDKISTLLFQSTLPARGATKASINSRLSELISIHAPRTGSDPFAAALVRRRPSDFNPRSPHGERQINPATMRGSQGISIHAPRTGSDQKAENGHEKERKFQSTLPARGATLSDVAKGRKRPHFNPRSPHGERLCSPRKTCVPRHNFNPRSPHGERRYPQHRKGTD